MSEHTWAQKRIAAYLAGKLKPADFERLESHAHDCPQCEQAVEVVHVGKGLEALFTEIRPSPELEKLAVAAFRKAPRPALLSRAAKKGMTIIAAILLLGAFGAFASNGLNGRNSHQPLSFVGSNIRGEDSDRHAFELTSFMPNAAQSPSGEVNGRYTGEVEKSAQSEREANLAQEMAQRAKGQTPPSPFQALNGTGVFANRPAGMGGFGGGMGGMMGIGGGIMGGGIGGGMGSVPNGMAGGIGGTPGSGLMAGSLGGGGRGPGLNQPSTPFYSQPQIANGFVPVSPSLGGFPEPSVPPPTSRSVAQPPTTGVESKTAITDSPATFEPGKVRPTLPPDQQKGTADGPPNQDPQKSVPPPPKGPATETQPKEPNPEPTRRIIIRSGDIEFELDSFDAATATITKLITEIKGAFIATVNSEKLPNGRVKGSITVRVPPEHLDSLVLDLRKELGKNGELKGVRISSQDVTKQYTDLESRLRGARTMEQRLIQIIKEGKGEIKQLLEAERELGIWRTKIEEFEGELRYYANMAAFSTLTIILTEKEVRAAAVLTESERVQAGVEVEDVDKAYQQLLAAVVEVKGRVTKSEVKQYAAGQFNATLNFEVAPDASGPMRDRLRQLGRVARLEIDRGQRTEGGTVAPDTKLKRGDSVFLVQLYNLANIAARETATLQVAAPDVASAYMALRDAIAKTTGRVVASQLNEQDKQNVTAQLDFEVRRTEEPVARAALEKAGEVISRQVNRAPESDNVTDTKVLHRVTIVASTRVKARETKTQQVVAPDVSVVYRSIREAVDKEKGRVVTAQLNEQDRQNVTAIFEFEIPRANENAVIAALNSAGEAVASQVIRVPENENASDSKVLYQLAFFAASHLKPRGTTNMTIEVKQVEEATARLEMEVAKVKDSRRLSGQSNRESSGKTVAKLSFDVPYSSAHDVVDGFRSVGTVRIFQTKDDPQGPQWEVCHRSVGDYRDKCRGDCARGRWAFDPGQARTVIQRFGTPQECHIRHFWSVCSIALGRDRVRRLSRRAASCRTGFSAGNYTPCSSRTIGIFNIFNITLVTTLCVVTCLRTLRVPALGLTKSSSEMERRRTRSVRRGITTQSIVTSINNNPRYDALRRNVSSDAPRPCPGTHKKLV